MFAGLHKEMKKVILELVASEKELELEAFRMASEERLSGQARDSTSYLGYCGGSCRPR